MIVDTSGTLAPAKGSLGNGNIVVQETIVMIMRKYWK